jgi:glycosyltransferase involved in cell wall biosynthesis
MTVSLIMIAKDEQRCIRRCLESFAPYVDEIVLGDTGSIDDTVAIAKEFGARVIQVQWQDDFAKARNEVLEKSSGNFNLIVDADEWLISNGERFSSIFKNSDPFIGKINIISSFNLNNRIEYSSEWISRLLPNNIRYEGRIHEQPVHNLPALKVPIVIQHDGYEKQQRDKKLVRNEKILKQSLKASPDDPYLLYQLGKELENTERFREASEFYRRALLMAPQSSTYRHDLVVRSIFAFKKAQFFSDIFTLAANIEWPQSPDFFFALGDALLDYAVNYLPLIEQAWKTCLELGDNNNLSGTVIGRGSFLAAENLAAFYGTVGYQEKEKYYSDLANELRASRAETLVPRSSYRSN